MLTAAAGEQRADFLHVLVDGLAELYTSVGDRDTTMRIVQPVRSFILAAVVTDLPYLMSARTLESSRVLLVPAAESPGPGILLAGSLDGTVKVWR